MEGVTFYVMLLIAFLVGVVLTALALYPIIRSLLRTQSIFYMKGLKQTEEVKELLKKQNVNIEVIKSIITG